MEGAIPSVRSEERSRDGHPRWVLPELLCLAFAFLAVLGVARWFAADVAGGSDSWGYISEAVRLSQGHLYEREQVLAPFGLPENAALTHPLAYLEKGREGTVPTYPFGYPLLMAIVVRLLGVRAAFWVTPLLAAGTVMLTYMLGRSALGRAGGAVAALLLAVLPSFLWGAFQPLSDVPAAFFCTLALVALLAMPPGVVGDALLAGALGVGIWVRPNMGLLVGVVGVWLVARREWRRFLRVALVLAPFLLVEGVINADLFGAPWRSGYGALPLGGPLAEMLARGGRHLQRLNAQQAGAGLALLALALVWNHIAVARRVLLAGVFGAFLCFFAAYRIDDAWWYFRFLVPAVPAVAVLEAGFLVRLTDPGRLRPVRVAAAAVITLVMADGALRFALKESIFGCADEERRYPRAAELVAQRVEQPAIVLAMQHSGSLRFHAGVRTARYDLRSPQELQETLSRVTAAGGRLYLLAENWEVQQIREGDRAFLLEGADEIGFIEPGRVTLFRLHLPASPGAKAAGGG